MMFVSGAVDLTVAELAGRNEWVSVVTVPLEVSVVLLLLAEWQPTHFLRLAHLVAVPIALLGTAVVMLAAGDVGAFSIWIAPGLALLALAGLLQTLVHSSLLSTESLMRQDWFWVCLGAAVFWLGFVTVPPFHRAFVESHPDWVRLAYLARAWVNIGAFLMVTWGVLCQRIPARYSGHS